MHNQLRTSDKLWTKNFILVIIHSLLTFTAHNMLITGIPLYALQLGGNNSTAGTIMGTFVVITLVVRPFFGKLLDVRSRKIVFIIGSLITTIVSFSYIFAFSIGMLIFIRTLNGIGFSANTNAAGTAVSDIIPRSRLGEGIGYFGIANPLASAIGPVLSLFIIKNYSYNRLFLITFAISIISFICSILIDYEKKIHGLKGNHIKNSEKSDKEKRVLRKLTDSMIEKTALPTGVVVLFLSTTIGAIMTFIPIYALSRGIENISAYFVTYAFTLILTRFFVGKLVDRYGNSPIIIPGMIITCLSFVVLAFAKTMPVILISGILYGLGFGSVQPTLNSIMIKLCPAHRRGVGNSTFFIAIDTGVGVGSVIWGILSQNYGFMSVYLSCATCVLIGLISYILVLNKQIKAQETLKDVNLKTAN